MKTYYFWGGSELEHLYVFSFHLVASFINLFEQLSKVNQSLIYPMVIFTQFSNWLIEQISVPSSS